MSHVHANTETGVTDLWRHQCISTVYMQVYLHSLYWSYVYTLPNSFSCQQETVIVWTARAQNWDKSFTHIEHRTGAVGLEGLVNLIPVFTLEHLLPSQWIPFLFPTYSLPLQSVYLFTLRRSVAESGYLICDAPLEGSARSSFAPLQESHRNHRCYVWTEALNPVWFSCWHKLSGIAWT